MDLGFNVTVVGLGLIGGTYAIGLRNLKPENVWGVDISEDTIGKAKKMGIIDEGYTDPSIPLSKSDLVIISVYPEATEKFIIENMDKFKSGALITDAVGIKTDLISSVAKVLRADIDFVGGHPMAGKEVGGLENAELEMFRGANYIITPTEKNKEENLKFIEDMARELGFKNVIRATPEIHDENIAYVSQLPHIVAVGMVNCKRVDDVDMYAGGSYRDTTRIARINSELWSELFIKNREALVDQIDLFMEYTKRLRDAIASEDSKAVKEMLKESYDRKGESL